MDALFELIQEDEERPEGTTLHRNRLRPLERSAEQEVILYTAPGMGDRQPPESVGGEEIGPNAEDRRTRTFFVEIRKQVPYDGEESAEEATDELYVWTVRTLCNSGYLGGLLARFPREEAINWDFAETRDAVYALCAVQFTIEYDTLRGDPAA